MCASFTVTEPSAVVSLVACEGLYGDIVCSSSQTHYHCAVNRTEIMPQLCNVVPTLKPTLLALFAFEKQVNGIEGGENGAGARTACQTINNFAVFLPRSSLLGLNSVVFDLSGFWRLSFTPCLSAYMLMR